MRLFVSLVTPALVAHTSLAAFYYPSPQAAFLEHILVDNWGAYASNFSSAITPCSNYVTEVGDPAVNSGRTTAAQWMRVAFHDFVTADVGAGTGGVDASIGFETERGENSGSAFNDSFTFWAPFVNDAVSSKLVYCPVGEGEFEASTILIPWEQWLISLDWEPSCLWGCVVGGESHIDQGESMRCRQIRRLVYRHRRPIWRIRWVFSRELGSTRPIPSG